ncbi:MAG: hypothetical protein WA772_06515 [Candidatus Acidiferrales bacterium]
MSNQAYLSIWLKDFPEEAMLARFGDFLATVPFSAKQPGFTHLEIQAVDATETPLFEQDLRSTPLDAPSIIELAKDYLHGDSSYKVRAHWDLWVFEGDPPSWQQSPQPIELRCNGENYDDGFWKENGHFEVNFGFEHMFTGHGGLLGIRQIARPAPQSREEADFLESMAKPANLQMYQEKTRENIKSLFAWVRQIENALPVDRLRLWSEGEENFEARLEEILAAR